MLNLAIRLLGLNRLWDAVDGIKTYLGAAGEILTGISGVAISAGNIINEAMPAMNAHDAGAILAFVKSMVNGQDHYAVACGVSAALICHGVQAIGLAHKNEKLVAQLSAAGAPANPPAPASAPEQTQQATPAAPIP